LLNRNLTPEERDEIVAHGAADPEWWVRSWLGDDPWSIQTEILEAVRDHKDVSVKSAHGIGKDWIAARVALWFGCCHQPSIVITTGPSDRQVRGILWKEISVAYQNATYPIGGRLLQQELKFAPNWWIWGFTAPERDPDKFQGFHEENVLVIIDEASGVSDEIYLAIDGILTSKNAHKLEIGNPTDPSSSFAKSFKTPRVKKISVTSFETPNFTDFGITLENIVNDTWREKITHEYRYPSLTTPEWVRNKYEDWGLENPLFRSRVLAEFPSEGVDTLIPLAWIEAAQQRVLEPTEPVTLGVDVAVEGDDLCVIGKRAGPVYRRHSKFGKVDTMTTTGHVVRALDETKAEIANVDVVGVGAGVVHRLGELGKPVAAASAGKKANDPEKYANQRSEWFWGLRCRFESKDIDIDPADEDLAAQLCAIRWKPDSRGRVQLQKKELMKKEIGCSPDDADACAISFARVSIFSFSFGIEDGEGTEQDAIEAMRALVNQGEAMVSAESIEKAKAIRRDATPAFATDILVKTSNPEALHTTLREALHGERGVDLTLVMGIGTPDGPMVIDGCNVVRVVGNAVEQVEKVMTNHGYAEVIGRRERPQSVENVIDAGSSSGSLIDEDLLDDGMPKPLMGIPVIHGIDNDGGW
jgi:hypothetical protein